MTPAPEDGKECQSEEDEEAGAGQKELAERLEQLRPAGRIAVAAVMMTPEAITAPSCTMVPS
jgi:hypothetical protein